MRFYLSWGVLEFETPSVIQVAGVSLSYPRHRLCIFGIFMLDTMYGSPLAVIVSILHTQLVQLAHLILF